MRNQVNAQIFPRDPSVSAIRVDNQGNRAARLFILGEAPGAEEERQGQPFVGEAGRLLFDLLSGMGVSREDVFMANVVRFRPWKLTAAGNRKDRKPSNREIEADGRVFKEDLVAVHPSVVLSLGVTAARELGLNVRLGMTKLRGQQIDIGGIAIVPSFHPGYIRRDGRKKPLFMADLHKCVQLLEDRSLRELAPSA